MPPPAAAPARPAAFASAADRKARAQADPVRPDERPRPRGVCRRSGGAPARRRRRPRRRATSSPPSRRAWPAGWGLAYDTGADRLWISNPDAPDFGHRATDSSTRTCPTGRRPATRSTSTRPAASGRPTGPTTRGPECSGTVNVGGDMCLFEMDPVAKAVTGRKICGPWSCFAARRRLRLRDRHLLRRRNQRGHGLPRRRLRQPSRLRVHRPVGSRGSHTTRPRGTCSSRATFACAFQHLGRDPRRTATRSSAASR